MADNITVAGSTFATDDVAAGVAAGAHVQRMKVGWGADNAYADVESSNPLPILGPRSTVATKSNVTAATTNTLILAANSARVMAALFNDSTSVLSVSLGTVAASQTSFTTKVAAAGYYEVPAGFTGEIRGIWVAANGAARVTQLT